MRFFLSLLLLLPMSFSWSESTNSIHAVLVGDTSSDLKTVIEHDLEHVKSLLHMIAEKTNMHLTIKTLTGSKVTVKNVHLLVDSLAKNKGISFFYFSGHGFRMLKDTSPWPRLTFMKQEDSMEAEKIASTLEKDNAHFTLVIFDCCNEYFLGKSQSLVLNKSVRNKKLSWETAQNLFIKTKGLIIMAASTPGEVARGNAKGSFFTTSFIDALTSFPNPENISWDTLFNNINRKCSTIDQHPICMVSVTHE